ncbi:glucosaminidase domain-containing protein [Pseudotenacibaculum sp. MALMAid0570]|uniref:glucosaminidase domain-containing protein n=1 Tax=Pseudotenacibaculum sp. MALMAid0570 TaxID=3143938 RepID=UPI0032DFB9A4
MRIRSLFILLAALFLASCSSSRRVTTKKKKQKVTVTESKTKNLPSVKQIQHVRKLERGNKSLNKHSLNYIRKYAPLAVMEMHEYKIPASITLAQGILESGNGRSQLASKSNNHFGIKCHTGWKGGRVYHDDDEKGECFRKYKYVESSYKDHSKFLSSRKRYAGLFKLRRTDYKGWARGLKKAGYATDRKYPKKLIKIIEDYKLYEFDKFSKKDLRRGKRVVKEDKKPEKKKKVKNSVKYYEVKKGDTLYSISKKFGTTVEVLKKLNKLKSNNLSIGQQLVVK